MTELYSLIKRNYDPSLSDQPTYSPPGDPPTALPSPNDPPPLRFHPAVQRFKDIMDGGVLGAVKSIEVKLHAVEGPPADMRYEFALGGGYTVMEMRYLAGATPRRPLPPSVPSNPDVDHAMSATLGFASIPSNPSLSNVSARISASLSDLLSLGFTPRSWRR
ncbi:hypothetical protein EUX98_g7883 [Antrodiella citrinella]|uniref:Uncharacterized protein n=1 Tax=Antrodiella citrinella TaxID=2447956 RepID=A0A4S4MKG0_9APHY|nr:hypothetical protein EUX98_g7883 [Antrodiella citrinella]